MMTMITLSFQTLASGADIKVKLSNANDASSVVSGTHFGGEVDLLESNKEDSDDSS